jgi:hypothetical protein
MYVCMYVCTQYSAFVLLAFVPAAGRILPEGSFFVTSLRFTAYGI